MGLVLSKFILYLYAEFDCFLGGRMINDAPHSFVEEANKGACTG